MLLLDAVIGTLLSKALEILLLDALLDTLLLDAIMGTLLSNALKMLPLDALLDALSRCLG
jgi:hypothetical protein